MSQTIQLNIVKGDLLLVKGGGSHPLKQHKWYISIKFCFSNKMFLLKFYSY
jgi:hypothetical protein